MRSQAASQGEVDLLCLLTVTLAALCQPLGGVSVPIRGGCSVQGLPKSSTETFENTSFWKPSLLGNTEEYGNILGFYWDSIPSFPSPKPEILNP